MFFKTIPIIKVSKTIVVVGFPELLLYFCFCYTKLREDLFFMFFLFVRVAQQIKRKSLWCGNLGEKDKNITSKRQNPTFSYDKEFVDFED